MLRKQFPKATAAEIKELAGLIKKVDNLSDRQPIERSYVPRESKVEPRAALPPRASIFSDIANVQPTRKGLNIDNPVVLLQILMPELKLYKWQFETLMQVAGYLTIGNWNKKTAIDYNNAFKLILAAANGSGKDMIVIAGFAVWFALVGARNRVIITSSSFEQTKYQTEVHIKELATRANSKFGPLFKYTQFHYVCPDLGSEIKLFATDEAKRAEGYHPYGDGSMAIIINEAKSVTEDIFDALSRCTGYSHWLEISSPGPRSGHMFAAACVAQQYPGPAIANQYYYRRVTAYECPHIPLSHIEAMKIAKGEQSPWFKSSILAEFSDLDSPVVISEESWNKCALNPPKEIGNDIGIGLDLAGGGDEDACFVRRGNKVIHKFFFRQSDTEIAAAIIDTQLDPWRKIDYVFRADNGGIGQAIIDKLRTKGWRVIRTNNQSPASNKLEFLNLGAQMWFWLKRLIERVDIILPVDVDKLKLQATTRNFRGLESTQGKLALESKQEARIAGRPSPDRADALVLCFYSYRPGYVVESKEKPKHLITAEELVKLAARGLLRRNDQSTPKGRFTLLTGKV